MIFVNLCCGKGILSLHVMMAWSVFLQRCVCWMSVFKVSGIISREMEKECVVVFDEAHNIDNVCIEALSVNIRQQTLDGATRNLSKVSQLIEK